MIFTEVTNSLWRNTCNFNTSHGRFKWCAYYVLESPFPVVHRMLLPWDCVCSLGTRIVMCSDTANNGLEIPSWMKICDHIMGVQWFGIRRTRAFHWTCDVKFFTFPYAPSTRKTRWVISLIGAQIIILRDSLQVDYAQLVFEHNKHGGVMYTQVLWALVPHKMGLII